MDNGKNNIWWLRFLVSQELSRPIIQMSSNNVYALINTITAGIIVTSSILIIEYHIYAAHLFSDQNFRIISTTLRIIY